MGCVQTGGCICSSEESRQSSEINSYMKKSAKSPIEHKLLLLGPGSTGKSTLFKSLRLAHKGSFDQTELELIAPLIRISCIKNIQILIKQSKILYDQDPQENKECYIPALYDNNNNNNNGKNDDIDIDNNNDNNNNETLNRIRILMEFDISKLLEQNRMSELESNDIEDNKNNNNNNDNDNGKDRETTESHASNISERESINNVLNASLEGKLELIGESINYLWNLDAIKATYNKRGNNFAFEDNSDYFFNTVLEVFEKGYAPSSQCYLKTKERTSGMVDYRYVSSDQKHNFRILDVGGQRADRRKWIHHFENVHALIFVASLVDYNSVLFEDSRVNGMIESAKVFHKFVNLPIFKNTAIILILNKNDLFMKKLENNISLSTCFSKEGGWEDETEYWNDEWNYDQNNNDNYTFEQYHQRCCQFIANIFFKRINNQNRPIYLHVTDATNTSIVENVFMHVQTVLIRNNMAKTGLTVSLSNTQSFKNSEDMLQQALKAYNSNNRPNSLNNNNNIPTNDNNNNNNNNNYNLEEESKDNEKSNDPSAEKFSHNKRNSARLRVNSLTGEDRDVPNH